jgi:hypothetical protein
MTTPNTKAGNKYRAVLEKIFFDRYRAGAEKIEFTRADLREAAEEHNISNLGDVLYSIRYRADLPERISATCEPGTTWYIFGTGTGRYVFRKSPVVEIAPSPSLYQIRIPEATPEIISKYAMTDEQAVLAKVRYNRLIDVFTGLTAYSLQNHLRTQVLDVGQLEVDELYVAINKEGHHFVIPVQAKGRTDKIGVVQIYQDLAFCRAIFPGIQVRPVAVQSMQNGAIAMFALKLQDDVVRVEYERQYRLVPQEELTPEVVAEIHQAAHAGPRADSASSDQAKRRKTRRFRRLRRR